MNTFYSSDHHRMLELLADQAIGGLDAAEQLELKSLLETNPDFDIESLDRTAAMLDIAASAEDIEPLPIHFRDRILAHVQLDSEVVGTVPPAAQPRSEIRWREVVAWTTASACLLLAVFPWSRWPETNPPSGPFTDPPVFVGKNTLPPRPNNDEGVLPNTKPMISQLREQLLNSAPDVLLLQLVSDTGGGVAGESGGDIVWSNGRQMGYLRLRGLAINDRAQRQYQLWIVGSDASGNEIINGGMFPVGRSTGELILPIQADHFVQQPKIFVVSVEPLGGGSALTPTLQAKADAVGP